MRPEHWAAVTMLAAEQWGLVSTPQAEAVGCPPRSLERAFSLQLLERFRRGVHLVRGTPPSP